jgi:hypothetical protein
MPLKECVDGNLEIELAQPLDEERVSDPIPLSLGFDLENTEGRLIFLGPGYLDDMQVVSLNERPESALLAEERGNGVAAVP